MRKTGLLLIDTSSDEDSVILYKLIVVSLSTNINIKKVIFVFGEQNGIKSVKLHKYIYKSVR